MSKKKILFLTATRADFGKIKPLMNIIEVSLLFELYIFVTGMHTLEKYGYTVNEVTKAGFKNIQVFMNQIPGEPMELVLANTINGLSRYVHELKPDLIVLHGDRVETLAGAIVGALKNLFVAHVEGGERSGTVDELMRHAITKLAHFHFVANREAETRLIQLGENTKNIFVIGSPDIDIMLSSNLPSLKQSKDYYEIPFDKYGIVLFHSVTTELETLAEKAKIIVETMIESKKNYIVIYPNNDEGSSYIFEAYKKLEGNPRFRILPSIRFEFFLTLLKNSEFIIGNSSAGVREAPVYSIYSINLGTRQKNRHENESIINIDFNKREILDAIKKLAILKPIKPSTYFGKGNSADSFIQILQRDSFWQTPKQKEFFDINIKNRLNKSQGKYLDEKILT